MLPRGCTILDCDAALEIPEMCFDQSCDALWDLGKTNKKCKSLTLGRRNDRCFRQSSSMCMKLDFRQQIMRN